MKLTRKHEVKKKQEMSEFKSSPQTLFLEYKKVQIKIPRLYTHPIQNYQTLSSQNKKTNITSK